MSYEIYYDRKFIKIEDKFIPIFQHGSNNCFEISYNGRHLNEKNWNVCHYTKEGQYIFTADEIRELAKRYDGYEPFKSRNRRFGDGEFERWFISGMKSAQPLEYYTGYGNRFYVNDWTDWDNQKQYYVNTNQELTDILNQLKGRKLSLKFAERELRLPKEKKNKERKEKKKYDFFFTLAKGYAYLCKLTRYGYRYVEDSGYYGLKKFTSEKAAEAYLKKHSSRLNGFNIVKVDKEYYI